MQYSYILNVLEQEYPVDWRFLKININGLRINIPFSIENLASYMIIAYHIRLTHSDIKYLAMRIVKEITEECENDDYITLYNIIDIRKLEKIAREEKDIKKLQFYEHVLKGVIDYENETREKMKQERKRQLGHVDIYDKKKKFSEAQSYENKQALKHIYGPTGLLGPVPTEEEIIWEDE